MTERRIGTLQQNSRAGKIRAAYEKLGIDADWQDIREIVGDVSVSKCIGWNEDEERWEYKTQLKLITRELALAGRRDFIRQNRRRQLHLRPENNEQSLKTHRLRDDSTPQIEAGRIALGIA
jgi:hypothetical protein